MKGNGGVLAQETPCGVRGGGVRFRSGIINPHLFQIENVPVVGVAGLVGHHKHLQHAKSLVRPAEKHHVTLSNILERGVASAGLEGIIEKQLVCAGS